MLLRTIEVPDADGSLVNAVILCSFTATRLNRQFLVYSLNEKLGDELIKIYLTAIEGHGLTLTMSAASTEMLTTATQVLKGIIDDARAPDARQTQDTYNVMDLTDMDVVCSATSGHRSLKISEEWMAKLLQYNPVISEDFVASPRERERVAPAPVINRVAQANNTDYRPTLALLTSPAHVPGIPPRPIRYSTAPVIDVQCEPTAAKPVVAAPPASPAAPVAPPTPLMKDEKLTTSTQQTATNQIETNLKSLISSVTNHKQTLSDKYARLDERQRALEQREHLLVMRELAVIKREEELMAGIESLQAVEQELNGLMCS